MAETTASQEEEEELPFYEVTKQNAKKHSPPKNTPKNKNTEDSFVSAVDSFMNLPTGKGAEGWTAPKRSTTPSTTSASASAATKTPTKTNKKQQKTPSPKKNKNKGKTSTAKDQFEDWMATTSREEQEEIMLQIVKTNQQRKMDARKKQQFQDPSDPSESSSSSSSSDSDDERPSKRSKKRYSKKQSDRQPSYRRQAFAAERLRNARPQKETDKYDGSLNMNYRRFKNRFMTFSDNKDINPLDVLNELPHWVAGPAKRLVEAFISLEDPKQAISTIWHEMDRSFSQTRKTVSEMVAEIASKNQLKSGDIDGMMDLQTELQTIRTEATVMGQMRELDDAHNIRNIVVKRLPHFMAKKFYDEQAERRIFSKEHTYEKNFTDVQGVVAKEIESLRGMGKTSSTSRNESKSICSHSVEQPRTEKKKSAAEVAAQTGPNQKQNELTGCEFCQAGHPIQKCNKLKEMSKEMRAEALKKGFFCFKCLKKGHRSVNCKQPHAECEECEKPHQTLLCGLVKFLATKKPATEVTKEREEAKAAEQQEGGEEKEA